MQFDKQMVIDFLREQGQQDQAGRADQELPQQVDSDRDAGLLQKFGVNPKDLIGRFTGGGGIPGL